MKTTIKIVTLALSIFFFLTQKQTKAQCHIDDWTALKALYESTKGDFWTNRAGWGTVLGNSPPANCNLDNLYGITLDASGRVNNIDFANGFASGFEQSVANNLSGSIPSEIGNLSSLKFFAIDNNQLIGSIPSELGNLLNLEWIYLTNNNLSGLIPPELGNLSNLTDLKLASNELSGSIPSELGTLSNLEELNLGGNQLSNTIPPEIGNLNNLTYLILSSNQLNGSIPVEIGNLSNLTYLSLNANQLSGSIPPEIGNLAKLTYLSLYTNQLGGSIPSELGNLSNLTELFLWRNQLNGSIPPELGNLSNLINLGLASNELSDNIPSELGNLSNLIHLNLFNNELSGSIPAGLCDLVSLTQLNIKNNNLQGCYPGCLDVFCNQLTNPLFDGNLNINNGNNFDATWEDFCATGAGACIDDCTTNCETAVYPGDLNYDGIVNNQDIGLSGLYLYNTGPTRAAEHQDIEWYPHPAQDWGIQQFNGEDLKHHDCNGDGQIDENDQQAIDQNLGETWSAPPPSNPPESSDYQVLLHPIDEVYDGYLVMNVALERQTGGDLTLQGGHFTIDYSDVEGNFSFVGLDFLPITWLGIPENNLWFDSTNFPNDKRIEVGFTKTNSTNSEGSGVVAQLILEYDITNARLGNQSDQVYQFNVNTIGVHNANAEFTPIEDQILHVNVGDNNCQINWIITNETPFQNAYQSNGNITTNGFKVIGEAQQVTFTANRITLNTGLKVKAGASFKAEFGGCD